MFPSRAALPRFSPDLEGQVVRPGQEGLNAGFSVCAFKYVAYEAFKLLAPAPTFIDPLATLAGNLSRLGLTVSRNEQIGGKLYAIVVKASRMAREPLCAVESVGITPTGRGVAADPGFPVYQAREGRPSDPKLIWEKVLDDLPAMLAMSDDVSLEQCRAICHAVSRQKQLSEPLRTAGW